MLSASCALIERRDPEALRPLIAERAVYQNVGMPESTGVEAILENVAAQFSVFPDAYAFEIVNIAGDGPVVLTERLDYIQTPDASVNKNVTTPEGAAAAGSADTPAESHNRPAHTSHIGGIRPRPPPRADR
jgi:limonene-1,2-epoxide hydrolase